MLSCSRVVSPSPNSHGGEEQLFVLFHSSIHKVPLHLQQERRRLRCCLRLFQDSRVPLHHGSISTRVSLSRSQAALIHPQGSSSLTTRTSAPKLLSRIVKTLGFRFTMKAIFRASIPLFQATSYLPTSLPTLPRLQRRCKCPAKATSLKLS
jgi:hypothetical protein